MLPQLLSVEDAAHYRQIFAAQNQSKWDEADREIAQLSDPLLLGTVEAQRYLSPRYHARYEELRDWLAGNADAPEVRAVYALALKRHTAGAPRPEPPETSPQTVAAHFFEDEDDSIVPRPLPARHGDVAAEGRDAPLVHWRDALADWRQARPDEALRHFETLARAPGQSPWVTAAAAFWAARMELRTRRPELFNYWLGVAAEHPRTFYGLLARRTLGVDTYLDFERDLFTELDAQILLGIPAGRRVLALIQIGETERAEAELRTLASRASSNVLQSLVALTDRTNMPGLSLRMAGRMADQDGRRHALYPVPRWTPRGGFTVDRALLFGLMRQESEFLPVAHNASGATGLMQLMPATARMMANRAGLSLKEGHGRNLSDPGINLALAQEYLHELIDDNRVRGNLLYLAVAYNCGPGALQKFQSATGVAEDPLMFIENISNLQTRSFVEHVLANYWIYRLRLGQATPDLDALAAGEWPTYIAQDQPAESLTRHADNR